MGKLNFEVYSKVVTEINDLAENKNILNTFEVSAISKVNLEIVNEVVLNGGVGNFFKITEGVLKMENRKFFPCDIHATRFLKELGLEKMFQRVIQLEKVKDLKKLRNSNKTCGPPLKPRGFGY